MKLASRRQHTPPVRQKRAPFPAIRWRRSQKGFERALLIKVVMVLLVAGIAIRAVSIMAHRVQATTASVNP